MLLTVMTIALVMIAIAMIAIILVQRGTGATAGASFGGGASGTVFGAQGSASFLSRSTSFLAIGFFVIALMMAVLVSRGVGVPDANDFSVIGDTSAPSVIDDVPAGAETESLVDDVPALISSDADDIPDITDMPEAAADIIDDSLPEAEETDSDNE